jgi:hypothetical protein
VIHLVSILASICFVEVFAKGFAVRGGALLRARQGELLVYAVVGKRGSAVPLFPAWTPSPRRRSARIRILAASISRRYRGPGDEQPADDSERNPDGDNRMTSNKNEGQKRGNRRGKGENRQYSEPPSPQIHAKLPNGRWDWTMKFVS